MSGAIGVSGRSSEAEGAAGTAVADHGAAASGNRWRSCCGREGFVGFPDRRAALAALTGDRRHPQNVLVQVTPAVDPHVHRAMATGVEDQKLGPSPALGAAADAVRRVLGQPSPTLAGDYNLVGRPPGIAARGGGAWPLVRRETAEDLFRRDVC